MEHETELYRIGTCVGTASARAHVRVDTADRRRRHRKRAGERAPDVRPPGREPAPCSMCRVGEMGGLLPCLKGAGGSDLGERLRGERLADLELERAAGHLVHVLHRPRTSHGPRARALRAAEVLRAGPAGRRACSAARRESRRRRGWASGRRARNERQIALRAAREARGRASEGAAPAGGGRSPVAEARAHELGARRRGERAAKTRGYASVVRDHSEHAVGARASRDESATRLSSLGRLGSGAQTARATTFDSRSVFWSSERSRCTSPYSRRRLCSATRCRRASGGGRRLGAVLAPPRASRRRVRESAHDLVAMSRLACENYLRVRARLGRARARACESRLPAAPRG